MIKSKILNAEEASLGRIEHSVIYKKKKKKQYHEKTLKKKKKRNNCNLLYPNTIEEKKESICSQPQPHQWIWELADQTMVLLGSFHKSVYNCMNEIRAVLQKI